MEKEEIKAKIDEMTRDVYAFAATCSEEEAEALASATSSICMRLAHRFSDKLKAARLRNLKAAESSPNKKEASARNIAKARESVSIESRRANIERGRLALLSARLKRKLGRDPHVADLVVFGNKTYVFGGISPETAENGKLLVSVMLRGIETARYYWIDGHLSTSEQ